MHLPGLTVPRMRREERNHGKCRIQFSLFGKLKHIKRKHPTRQQPAAHAVIWHVIQKCCHQTTELLLSSTHPLQNNIGSASRTKTPELQRFSVKPMLYIDEYKSVYLPSVSSDTSDFEVNFPQRSFKTAGRISLMRDILARWNLTFGGPQSNY